MRKQFLTLTLIGAAALILTTSCGGGSSSADKGTASTTTDAGKPKPADNHYTEKDLVKKDLTADGIGATIMAPKDAYIIWASDKHEAYLYGGKFFKVTLYSDTSMSADDSYEMSKKLVSDKDLNPNFVKFDEDKGTCMLKESKDNKLAFMVFVPTKTGCYHLSDGMAYDSSPDQSSDYTPDDIKAEYAAAKTFTLTK